MVNTSSPKKTTLERLATGFQWTVAWALGLGLGWDVSRDPEGRDGILFLFGFAWTLFLMIGYVWWKEHQENERRSPPFPPH